MKKIEAYVKPFRLGEVRDALARARLDVLRVHVAEELRPGEAYTEVVQGTKYDLDVIPRTLIVLLVADDSVEEAVRLIQSAGKTEHSSDGHILVTHIERAYPIDPEDSPASVSSTDSEPTGAEPTGADPLHGADLR